VPVWTGAENLAYTRIRSPYRPAHSEPFGLTVIIIIIIIIIIMAAGIA
jgi:hypothetical protein